MRDGLIVRDAAFWSPRGARLPLAGARIACSRRRSTRTSSSTTRSSASRRRAPRSLVAGYDESAYRGIFWSLALAARGRMAMSRLRRARLHRRTRNADRRRHDRRGARRRRPSTPSSSPAGTQPTTCAAREPVLELCRAVAARGRPVAAICHGPWVLAQRRPPAGPSRHRSLGDPARRRGRRRDLGRRALRRRRPDRDRALPARPRPVLPDDRAPCAERQGHRTSDR